MHLDARVSFSGGLGAIALLAVAAGCAAKSPLAQRANPASGHCVRQGGKLLIERGPGGGEYGVCLFEDNRQCEEWALLRGACPAGGLRVTGYLTAAARYCAITGGHYLVTAQSGAADEEGSCTLPDGRRCDAGGYFAGTCSSAAAQP